MFYMCYIGKCVFVILYAVFFCFFWVYLLWKKLETFIKRVLICCMHNCSWVQYCIINIIIIFSKSKTNAKTFLIKVSQMISD